MRNGHFRIPMMPCMKAAALVTLTIATVMLTGCEKSKSSKSQPQAAPATPTPTTPAPAVPSNANAKAALTVVPDNTDYDVFVAVADAIPKSTIIHANSDAMVNGVIDSIGIYTGYHFKYPAKTGAVKVDITLTDPNGTVVNMTLTTIVP